MHELMTRLGCMVSNGFKKNDTFNIKLDAEKATHHQAAFEQTKPTILIRSVNYFQLAGHIITFETIILILQGLFFELVLLKMRNENCCFKTT